MLFRSAGGCELHGVPTGQHAHVDRVLELTSPRRDVRVVDPAADKALMLAVFATLALLDNVPAWLAFLVIARDALIVLGVLIAFAVQAPIAVKPLFIGKLCTALQLIYIGLHLASLAFEFSIDGIAPADTYAVAGITLASFLAYFGVWISAMRMPRNADVRRA